MRYDTRWVTTELAMMHSEGSPVMAYVRVNENGLFEFAVFNKDRSRLYGEDALSLGIAVGRCERYLRTVGWLDTKGKKLPLVSADGTKLPLPK